MVKSYPLIEIGLGLLEIESGISGIGSSMLIEVGSGGTATAVAVPTAVGGWALVVDGIIKVGHGTTLFRKKSKESYKDPNFDPQRKGMPTSRDAQKKQFEGALKRIEKELGRKIDGKSRQRLHRAIHGQDYGYWDIIDMGVEMFRKP